MGKKKRHPLNVRYEPELQERMDRIVKESGLPTRSDLLRIIASAGVAAIEKNHFKIPLPLQFKIDER